MKIKKVDDKPMVIHTKQKAEIHTHESKKASIKGNNIYMVERGTKTKSTIHQSEPKNKGCVRELPLDKFGINNGYIRSFCKDCNNKYHREYRHSFLHR